VTEHTGIELTMWMQKRLGLYHFTHGVVTNAMFALMQNQKYTRNHVLDGMTAKWDGVARLETMFMHGFGAEDTEYHRMIGRMWAVSAIARLLAPGCQVDTMLVLEGDQGIGKSMALQVLGGAGYAALQQKLDNKDFLVTAHTAWIVDMVELGAMKYADMEQIKGLITTRVDSFRSPYGRTSRDRKRRFIMVGTTNSDDYLRDETGNRRFWPVKCNGEIDLAWLEENRDQIWAEARHRYDAGEQWWEDFNAETAEATRAIQNARVADDPWNDVLVTKLNDTTPMRRITWGATLYYFVAGVELLAALGIAVNDMPKYSRRLRAAMRHNKEWTAHMYQSAVTPIELTTGGKTLRIRGYIRPVDNVAIMPPPDNVTSLPTSGSKPASKI
jgi:predicted P-loop ATPase